MTATEAVIHAASIPVSPGWTPTTWTIIAVASPFLLALAKFWPAMKKLSNDRGDNLDEERRQDMKVMRERLAKIEVNAQVAFDRAIKAEVSLSTALVIIRLMSTRIRAQWPDDPLLKDAEDLLNEVTGATVPREMLAMMNRIRKDEP